MKVSQAVLARVPDATLQAEQANSALAPRTTRSRLIRDRDAQASWEQVFLGNGPDDCCGRLGEVTRSLRLRQRWLRQSVGRQSSLTENQLSNQCANRKSARQAEKVRDSRGFRRTAGHPHRAAMPCICAVAHMLAHCRAPSPSFRARGAQARNPSGTCTGCEMDSGFDASHRPQVRNCAPRMTEDRCCACQPAYFVCVRIGESFRPLLSYALRKVPLEIASVMNFTANASDCG